MMRTALVAARAAKNKLQPCGNRATRRFSTKANDKNDTERVLDDVGKTLTAWNKMQPAAEGFVKTKSFEGVTKAVTSAILWSAASGCGIYSTYRFWNQCDACARREYEEKKALREAQRDYNELKKLRDAEAASA
jgi:hypothetical protein